MTTRRYNQKRRAEAADATRRRILDALYERIREAPTQQVSVDQVAQAAGVARSTVYLIFESRTGLFDALATDLWQRGGLERLTEATKHPDAREVMRGGIRAGAEIFAAHREVLRALFSMAQIDADAVGGAIHRKEARRAGGMAYLAGRLAEDGLLRPGLTAADAEHLLWLVTSFDAFDLLYTERHLSVAETARLLDLMAERSVCI